MTTPVSDHDMWKFKHKTSLYAVTAIIMKSTNFAFPQKLLYSYAAWVCMTL